MSSKRRATAIFLAVLFYLLAGARAAMVRGARAEAERARQQAVQTRLVLASVQADIVRANGRHLRQYTSRLSLSGASLSLERAERVLAEAQEARHPREIRGAARNASALLADAASKAARVRSQVHRLDEALAGYAAATSAAQGAVERAAAVIASVQRQGYRTSSLADAEVLRGQAEAAAKRAKALAGQTVDAGLPDYLAVFTTAQDAARLAEASCQAALSVPALRRENERRIAALPSQLASAKTALPAARAACGLLFRYPAYQGIADRVGIAAGSLGRVETLAASARQLNSMSVQRFAEAARVLADAERTLANAQAAFTRAVGTQRAVVAALAAMSAASSGADAEISRARARINSYRHNNQHRADDLVGQAEGARRRGGLLMATDPLEAVQEFRAARSLAEQAYNAVDTSSHSSGGGFSGGGEGGSGGGPSGGFSGGPSGGFSGGPSGGGVGGGGF